MSSEADVRIHVFGVMWDHASADGPWHPDACTEERCTMTTALDDYKEQIERRLLAQQPARVHLAHDERCETCNDVAVWMAKISREHTARQTQETSG